jgi:glycosyltransferase involved in cell wall biosynthesis
VASSPAVSVLLPVYNRERLIADAIRSILAQSFADLELIVVDDGSTDGSAEVVKSFSDSRIRIVSHPANRGIPAARNTALDEARGRFIAWLDSDDVARPSRLAEQVGFLERNHEIAMVGSCAGKIDGEGRRLGGIRLVPFASEDIRAWHLFTPAFQQSAIMGRAEVLRGYRYREDYPVCEDLELTTRVIGEHRTANIPKALIDRRLHTGQSIETSKPEIAERKRALLTSMLSEIGVSFTMDDVDRHIELGLIKMPTALPADAYLDWANDWLGRLDAANHQSRSYEPRALRFASGYFWLRACRRAMRTSGPAGLGGLLTGRRSAGLLGANSRRWVSQAFPLLAA